MIFRIAVCPSTAADPGKTTRQRDCVRSLLNLVEDEPMESTAQPRSASQGVPGDMQSGSGGDGSESHCSDGSEEKRDGDAPKRLPAPEHEAAAPRPDPLVAPTCDRLRVRRRRARRSRSKWK